MNKRTWQQVGEIVRDRRESLGMSREVAAARGNEQVGAQSLSPANVTVFESGGRQSYRRRTLLGLARALDWPDDAIDRLRAGEDPAALRRPDRDDMGGVAALSADLSEVERREVAAFIRGILAARRS